MKTHQTCPECGHQECCTIFDDGGFFCHSCGAKPKGKVSAMDSSFDDLELKPVGYRGISKEIAKKYNILTGFDSEGKEVTRVYPYPHRPKVRVLPKDFSKNKGFINNHLLGMDFFNAGSSKKITIVEGEDDWGSTIQMLGDRWPVVALPGAGTVKNVLKNPKCYDYLSAFDSIYIASDSDEAGDKTAQELLRAFPGKCYRVQMTTHKDPNEYLEAGDDKDFMYAWINAKKYVPDNVYNTPDQFLSLFRDAPEHQYIPTGISSLDEKILGLMQGHFTVIKAPTGIGKTEFMRYLEYKMLSEGIRIATWHLEETKQRSLLGLVSYDQGENLTRRDIIEEKEAVDRVEQSIITLTQDENLYQFYMDDHSSVDDLCEQIRYFSEVCGCQFVFFEPIQDAVNESTDEGKEAALATLSIRLSKLAAQLGVGIVTIAHTNDQGDTKYCKMIGQRASVIIDLQRNKNAEDEDEKNTTYMEVQKNRPASLEGPAGAMAFDLGSFTMKEKLLPF